jgi:hypothetical protein
MFRRSLSMSTLQARVTAAASWSSTEQVLQRRVLVVSLIGERECPMERLL